MRRVSRFTYRGVERIAIELDGMLCYQITPKRGYRNFKPGRRIGIVHLGFLRTLFYNILWKCA